MTVADPYELVRRIKLQAYALGFDLVGVASAEPSHYRDYFRTWLDDGRGGEMAYLADRFAERVDPAVYFPGVRSVVCVALNYHAPLAEASTDEPGRVARYALGDDYHAHVKPRLYDLADWLREFVPGCQTRCGVDSVPVMEKELAVRAGIGWMGKNTCVIDPVVGSYLLLGEVMTTLDLPADQPGVDRCGTCTRCIDACPTAAITAPYQLDASRCVSYLTIEHRGAIAADLQRGMGDWVYGCDICQEVCPWNRQPPAAIDPRLTPRFADGTLDVAAVLSWGLDDYRPRLKGSAMKRVKLPVLQRNASIARENGRRSSGGRTPAG